MPLRLMIGFFFFVLGWVFECFLFLKTRLSPRQITDLSCRLRPAVTSPFPPLGLPDQEIVSPIELSPLSLFLPPPPSCKILDGEFTFFPLDFFSPPLQSHILGGPFLCTRTKFRVPPFPPPKGSEGRLLTVHFPFFPPSRERTRTAILH